MNTPFFRKLAKQRDLIVVLGVVSIILVLIIPLPVFLLDSLLSISLCIGLIVLLTTMYNKEALDFSVFPSLLLTVTLFRLALNVATTRLILGHGIAGKVVEVFGTFVTGGNPLVGLIIFLIIVIIQFIVITKGSGQNSGSRRTFHVGRDARQADGH